MSFNAQNNIDVYGPYNDKTTSLIITNDRLVLAGLVDTVSESVIDYSFDINTLSRTFPFPTNSVLTITYHLTSDVRLAIKAFRDEDLEIHVLDNVDNRSFSLTAVSLKSWHKFTLDELDHTSYDMLPVYPTLRVSFLFGKIEENGI